MKLRWIYSMWNTLLPKVDTLTSAAPPPLTCGIFNGLDFDFIYKLC